MKNLVSFLNEARRRQLSVKPEQLTNEIISAGADAICANYPNSKYYTKTSVMKDLSNIEGNVYLDGMDVVVGDKTVAEFFDDGTMLFPAGFPKELAIAIRDEFAYNSAEGSGDPKDNTIIIGDEDNPEWNEYVENEKLGQR